jgi:formate dehydrogenase major subunit
MGHGAQFPFHSAAEIWEEIRGVWPAGAGITYERIEHHGIQWPCPDTSHHGTAILHERTFPGGPTAPLKCIEFRPTEERADADFPFLLTTGRTLYQFNAGTMTMRTPNATLRETDTVDMAPADLARLGLTDGARVRLRSRHGSAILPVRADARLQPGEVFATFHAADVSLNQLTSPHRDNHVQTPEYKVVAVHIEPVSNT